MNVQKLIQELSKLPPDAEVFKSKDEEGNGFDDVWEVSFGPCGDDGREIWPIHPDDFAEYSDEDKAEIKNAVILW